MSEAELKPCPFCGWAKVFLFDTKEAPFWVECPDCFAQGSPCDTEAEAIAAWNTRHRATAIAAYLAQREAEGFVMVPVDPTEAMIRAAWAVEDSAPRHQVMTREMYIAMIAARPKGEVK